MTNVPRVVDLLGYAGLVPFVVPAILVASGSDFSPWSLQLAGIYAFGITSFLTGSWWGIALSTGSSALLVSSNILFLVGFFVFVFAPDWWPLAAALLLLTILVTERSGVHFPACPDRYRGLRMRLTLIASAALLTLHIAA